MKTTGSEGLRIAVFLLGLAVCVLGTELAWPGFAVAGRFYRYPVTGAGWTVVVIWWLAVLGVTSLALRKLRK